MTGKGRNGILSIKFKNLEVTQPNLERLLAMPTEIFNKEEFLNLAQRASECRVKRLKDVVKLKLRTPRQLYTIKVDEETAEEIIKEIRCPIIDV